MFKTTLHKCRKKQQDNYMYTYILKSGTLIIYILCRAIFFISFNILVLILISQLDVLTFLITHVYKRSFSFR